MAVMDEFKEEREKVKHGTFKEKLSYFWYYYKWHTTIIIVVIIFLINMIQTMKTNTDSILHGIL